MFTVKKGVLAALLMVCSGLVAAADPEFYSHKRLGAIKGVDVVAYFSLQPGEAAVKGTREFTYVWKDTEWRFSSAENRDTFIANPNRYAPQFGGYCAFATAHNFTTSIWPDSWIIIEDKLYLNHNRTSAKKFRKSPDYYIDRANKNWPTVLEKCEKRKKCKKPFKLKS